MLQLRGISKSYSFENGAVRALDNVFLFVDRGEFVALVGPSGSGKSTLLYVTGLLLRPDSGQYLFEGRQVTELDDKKASEFRREKIGFIFQEFYLIPTMTALENVMMPLGYHDMDRAEAEKRAVAMLKRLGLGRRISHYPRQLSGGERQRVAVARALVIRPELILADEPTGNLDVKAGREVLRLLKEINEDGMTVLMVTHDEEAAEYADRVIRMADGKIV